MTDQDFTAQLTANIEAFELQCQASCEKMLAQAQENFDKTQAANQALRQALTPAVVK